MPLRVFLFLAVLISSASASDLPAVQRSVFGRMPDGTTVDLFTLTNRHGLVAKVITYGAILADLRVPDREGHLAGVVREVVFSEQGFQRGFTNPAAIQGRVANRIARARFTLDGHEYQLAAKAERPDLFVAMAAYGDYGPGYIGTAVAYQQGGYEVTEYASSNVAPEVEGVLMTAIKKLLH